MNPNNQNYMKLIRQMHASGQLDTLSTGIVHMHIGHDDWCMFFNGEDCNCEPTLEVSSEPPKPTEPPKPNRAERRRKK